MAFFFQIPKGTKLVKQRLVVRSSSSGSAENGDVNGFSLKPNKLFIQEVKFNLVWFLLVERMEIDGFIDDLLNYRRLELSMEKGLRLLDKMVLLKWMW